jgi:hypothetical protein
MKVWNRHRVKEKRKKMLTAFTGMYNPRKSAS